MEYKITKKQIEKLRLYFKQENEYEANSLLDKIEGKGGDDIGRRSA